MKIVSSGFKADFHIHSVYSRGKDGKKVRYNTIENIDVLKQKLNENGVQLCAITDHDAFGYDIYKKLKESETDDTSSIVKVFPGVEFSVQFIGDNKTPTVLHVIAIFNDEDDARIAQIPSCISGMDGKPKYDCGQAFSEAMFLSILRDIDLDTVLIVHQKIVFYRMIERIMMQTRLETANSMSLFIRTILKHSSLETGKTKSSISTL